MVVVFELLFLPCTPAVFGSAGDHTRSAAALAAAFLPGYVHSSGLTLHIWNVELFAFFFSPYSEQAPSGLVFKNIAKLF